MGGAGFLHAQAHGERVPRIVVFVLTSDPKGVERLGSYLPDGSLVDLQAAHFSMREKPSPFLRDRTSYRLGGEASRRTVQDVLAWVDTERPPGLALPAAKGRVVEEMAPTS